MNIYDYINAINPEQHEKYSRNLYKWIKKNKNFFKILNVYRNPKEENRLYIGYIFENTFWGLNINSVLCNLTNNLLCFHSNITENLILVEDFWEKYILTGRCAIDINHTTSFLNSENRWLYFDDGNKKRCTWCNNCIKTRETYTVTQIKYRWI